eukprot:m.92303 g.92303  ORF g.92303 m.92303 type:complete len:1452 (-) comp13345_c0_seq1:5725-10080(-)
MEEEDPLLGLVEISPKNPRNAGIIKRKFSRTVQEIPSTSFKANLPDEGSAYSDFFENPRHKHLSEIIDQLFRHQDEQDITSEGVKIPRSLISELKVELCRLKPSGKLKLIPLETLLRIIRALQSVLNGCDRTMACTDSAQEEPVDDLLASMDAALTVLHIYASGSMPKQIYQEDVLEIIVSLIKHQIKNTIFPAFAPLEIDAFEIEDESPKKIPRRKSSSAKRRRSTQIRPVGSFASEVFSITNDILEQLVEVMRDQRMPDSVVLQATSAALSTFFAEGNLHILQQTSMQLVRTVFSRYPAHRIIVLDELIVSIKGLPKRGKINRNFKLPNGKPIQMVSALFLVLVQSACESIDAEAVLGDINVRGKQDVPVSLFNVFQEGYEEVERVAQSFLSAFLQKCTQKQEEYDYKLFLEGFVEDILSVHCHPEWPVTDTVLYNFIHILLKLRKQKDIFLKLGGLDLLGNVAARIREVELLSEKAKHFDSSRHELVRILSGFLVSKGDKYFGSESAAKYLICQYIPDFLPKGEEPQSKLDKDSVDFCISVLHTLAKGADGDTITREEAFYVLSTLLCRRPLCQSLDNLLRHIITSLNDVNTLSRSKALKTLATVIDVDSNMLSNQMVKKAVEERFKDKQISVREAAIDLVGRFVLSNPSLTHQYYDIFMSRILDSGLSVRKRVVKILRDICIQQPEFPKVAEISLRLLRRINDVQGVKELVTKSLYQIWFQAPPKGWGPDSSKKALINLRAVCIAQVLSLSEESSQIQTQYCFENLLVNFKKNQNEEFQSVCSLIVDSLINGLFKLEEASNSDIDSGVLTNLRALYVFSQVYPEVFVPHIETLLPYLKTDTKGNMGTRLGSHILYFTAKILGAVIPSCRNLRNSTQKTLEETLVNHILTGSATAVVQACVECLSGCIALSGNFDLACKTLQQFYKYLKDELDDRHVGRVEVRLPWIRRFLYASGLFCQYFDFSSDSQLSNPDDIEDLEDSSKRDVVFKILMKFTDFKDDLVKLKAISGLGCMALRHPHFLVRPECKKLYNDMLSNASDNMKQQVLENLRSLLLAEEKNLTKLTDSESQTLSKDLKKMGSDDSGFVGMILLNVEDQIRTLVCNRNPRLRQASFSVMKLILQQGLVHPMEYSSHLIALTTDPIQNIRENAQQQLSDMSNQYPDFVLQKAVEGIRLSFQFCNNLADTTYIHGYRKDSKNETAVAILSLLYNLLRSKRAMRRMLLSNLVSLFQESSNISELKFIAGNLAYFPYQICEEVLFLIYEIHAFVAVHETALETQFDQLLNSNEEIPDNGNRDEILNRIGQNPSEDLKKACTAAEALIILLRLKQFLKQANGFTELRCNSYSPEDTAKSHDSKVLLRKMELLQFHSIDSQDIRSKIADVYLQFRELIKSQDVAEEGIDSSVDSQRVQEKEKTKRPRRSSSSHKASTRRKKRKPCDSDDDDDDPDWC